MPLPHRHYQPRKSKCLLQGQQGRSPAAQQRRWLWISGGQTVGAPGPEPIRGLPALTRAWQRGELSNFDYLMELNLVAGRRLGDLTRYALLPWVLDMTEPPEAGMKNSEVSHSAAVTAGRAERGAVVHSTVLSCVLMHG